MNEKHRIRKYLFLILSVLAVAALIVLPFALDKMNGAGDDGASILSTTVRRADISRTVSGAGTLEARDAVELTVPKAVVITGYLVKDGDLVREGDPVASVDAVSVYKAASELADSLTSVTEELSALQTGTEDYRSISSNVEGTVTAVYVQPGDKIRDVMNRFGRLFEITLEDGRVLPVTGTSGTISWVYVREGDAVYSGNSLFTVYDEDGTESYGALVLKRQKIENQIAQLFRMLRDGYAAAPGDGMIFGTDESLVKKLSAYDGGELRVRLLSAGSEDAPAPSTTEYLSGTLSSSLDSAHQATVTGVDGTLDFSAFPDSKRGDTVFLRRDTYTETLPDGTEQVVSIEYTVLLVNASNSGTDGGGGMPGGGGMSGGGGFSGGGGASSSASGTGSADEASLDTTLIASVVPTDEVLVKITVDELDILTLHEGDRAQVTIDALPGRAFQGLVTGVNTGRSNSGGNSKYTAEVAIPLTEGMLAGMNASCLVTIETLKDVLTVPANAIVDERDGPVVYTALGRDGEELSQPVPVKLGLSDGESVEILSGLHEGDTIWYKTYDTPEYGMSTARSGSLFGNSRQRRYQR